MARPNKKCICCSTRYSYCPSCSRADATKPSWYNEFCSETCMTLWYTLTKYNMNMLTKSDAKSTISKLDLNPIDSYASCIQRDYAKVMIDEKKPKRVQKKIEPVVEENLVEAIESVLLPIEQPKITIEESHEVVKKENE